MKRNLILATIVCVAGFAPCPCSDAQDGSPKPATSGAGSATGGLQSERPGGVTLKKQANDLTRSPCWDCHRWLEPRRLDKLTTDLGLTTEQQTEIKTVLNEAHTRNLTTKQDGSLSQKEKSARFKEAWDTANTRINAVLTRIQQETFAVVKDRYPNQEK